MLILVRTAGVSRHLPGNGVRIQHPAGDVWLYVLDAHGSTVTLGFNAPREVGIHREEVLERTPDEVPDAGM